MELDTWNKNGTAVIGLLILEPLEPVYVRIEIKFLTGVGIYNAPV